MKRARKSLTILLVLSLLFTTFITSASADVVDDNNATITIAAETGTLCMLIEQRLTKDRLQLPMMTMNGQQHKITEPN